MHLEYLRTAEGDALWKALVATREALDEAHERYQRALAAAMEADAGVNGERAVRSEGRAYAAALTKHSNAAMAWLSYVDTHLHPKNGGGRSLSI